MSKKSGSISNLNKSTKVTIASCIGFILLTGIILVIFILFPITPSEKVLVSIGRENVANPVSENQVNSTTVQAVSTEKSTSTEAETTTTTKPVSTTTKTVNIRITSGSGFLWNGRIPTGVTPSVPTTPVITPQVPTADPSVTGGTDIPQGTTQLTPTTPPSTDVPSTPVDPDPNGGEVTTPPVETPVTPPVTPPETPVEPPAETPPAVEPPPADSGVTPEA